MANGNRSEQRRRGWQREIERWQRSGESIRAFCARRGLSEPSFYSWRRRLGAGPSPKRSGASSSRPAFAEVQLAAEGEANGVDDSIDLTLPTGERLRIGPAVEPAHLQRVLSALREAG